MYISRKYFDAVTLKILLVVIIAGLGGLMVVNYLSVTDPVKEAALSYSSRPGELSQGYVYYPGEPLITLELVNYSSLPKAQVLLNHAPCANFSGRYVSIPVAGGDLLQIDSSFYSHPVEVKVLDVSDHVRSPQPGLLVKVDGTIATVGTVVTVRNN